MRSDETDRVYDHCYAIAKVVNEKLCAGDVACDKYTLDPKWVGDQYYINIWDNEMNELVAEQVDTAGDCEDVWAWFDKQYPDITDWYE